MKPLLPWPGGKTRFAGRLVRNFPAHRRFVEPFVSGGAVFFQKKLAELSVLGDNSPWLIPFYDMARRGRLRKCRVRSTAENVRRLRQKKKLSACDHFALSNMTYHGDRRSFFGPTKARQYPWAGAHKIKQLARYEQMLRAAHLRLADYASTMRKFDGPDTLHFLDPPWVGGDEKKGGEWDDYSKKYKRGAGGNSRKKMPTPAEIAKVARGMKGYVMAIYGQTPEVEAAFCRRGSGFRCHTLRTTREAVGGRTRGKTTRHLVAVNYDIKTGKRFPRRKKR